MNVTLQILVEPATHTLADPAKNARRYAVGDIVCVWDADVVAPYNGTNHLMLDVISSTKYVFVHVRGVPDRPLDIIRNRLLADDTEVGTFWDEEDQRNTLAIIGYYRRKRFNAVLANIPTNIRNRLQSDRQITVTWTQVKTYIKNLRANTPLSDSDITST